MLTSKLYNAAGKRNNYLTIERATDATANSTGEVLPEFSPFCKKFASIRPRHGTEFTAAMTVQPMLHAIIELPYDSDTSTITPRDRLILSGRTFNIVHAFNDNENNEKIILWIIEPVAA